MKLTNCPRCGGKLRCESIGWKCEKCKGFIDMQGNFHEHTEKPFMPPMTNADRIRAMRDEELAWFMADRNVNESTLLLLDKDHGLTAVEKDALRNNIYCALRNWLQQPAEGD